MSIMSKVKKFIPNALKVVAVSGLIVAAGLVGLHTIRVHAATVYNCDANSVLWCGATSQSNYADKYDNGDGHNSVASIHNIYDWFGVTSSTVGEMSGSVSGTVGRDGDIYAGSTLVATNALTGGRENISGSVKRVENGTTFYTRAPSVSFLDASLPAMVVMKDGVFQYAILYACGNPVIGTPKKPAYTIVKQVRAAGSSSYGSNVSVKSGTTVQYQITVSSTGAVPVDNVTTHDSLPSDIKYTTGTLESNGTAVSAANATKFFGSGIVTSSINNGSKVVYTFSAVAGTTSATASTCKAETLNNEGYITSAGLPNEQSGATVTTECTPPPPPVTPCLVCESLTLTPGTIESNGDQSYTLEAKGSATNATITGYAFTFGDSASQTVTTSATSASTTHTYAPGTYTASVTVTATANGKTYTETSTGCKASITVTPPAPKPGTLVCDELTLTAGTADSNGNTPYTLSAKADASNATITGYNFTLGDGSSNTTVTTGASTASTTHTYAPGTYTASVIVDGVINGKNVTETSANCSGSITVKPPVVIPPTPVYVCDDLTLSPTTQPDAQGNVTYSLTATASASNATITSYDFNFGDNSQDKTITTSDVTANTTHTYAPGTYTAQVTVTVTLTDGTTKQVTADACKAQVVVAAPTCTAPNGQSYPAGSSQCTPTCTSPTTGQTYPMGSSQCTPAPTCVSPTTGQTYPKGSSECTAPTCTSPSTGKTYPAGSTECQTPATTLPNTGPGDIIGLFSGATLAGAVFHWMRGRRALRG